jgi:hypothetical protein
MRTIGVMPVGNAAMQICATSSRENAPCSMSMNSQSCPVAAAIIPAAAVRKWCTPNPSAIPPARNFRIVAFSTRGMCFSVMPRIEARAKVTATLPNCRRM